MRRHLAYPALAALLLTVALTGCRQEPLPASDDAIRFSVAPAEVTLQTKAGKPNDSAYLITVGKEALLYGSYYVAGSADKTSLFGTGGTTLACTEVTATGSTWSYDPLKYWDNRYSFDFRAVFPKEKVEGNITEGSSSQVNISYAMSAGYDLMVAAATGQTKATPAAPVPLTFTHACAAVRFLFTDGSNEYVLKSFQLKKIDTAGTLQYGAATPWAPSTSDTRVYQWSGSSWEIPNTPTAIPDTPAASDGWYYVIPQTLSATEGSAAEIYFTYAVSSSATDQNIPVTLKLNTSGSASNITSWDAGKAYTYKIAIQANSISFGVVWTNWGSTTTTDLTEVEPTIP